MKVRIKFKYIINGCGVREYDNELDVDSIDEALKKAVIEVARTTPLSIKQVVNHIIGQPSILVDDYNREEYQCNATPSQIMIDMVTLAKNTDSTASLESFTRIDKKKINFKDFLSRTKSGKRNKKRKW